LEKGKTGGEWGSPWGGVRNSEEFLPGSRDQRGPGEGGSKIGGIGERESRSLLYRKRGGAAQNRKTWGDERGGLSGDMTVGKNGSGGDVISGGRGTHIETMTGAVAGGGLGRGNGFFPTLDNPGGGG